MDKLEMRVTMTVTEPQALALQAMFEYWNWLGRVGASRHVSFFVDGDGDFRPDCCFTFSEDLPHLTQGLRDLAVIAENGGHRKYDFDPIAWSLPDDTDEIVDGPPQWWRVLWHRIRLRLSVDDGKGDR